MRLTSACLMGLARRGLRIGLASLARVRAHFEPHPKARSPSARRHQYDRPEPLNKREPRTTQTISSQSKSVNRALL